MRLTSRAKQCLGRGSRSIEPPCPLDVGQQLLDAGLHAHDAVIETFTNFGGYWHPIGATGSFRINTIQTALKQPRFITDSELPEGFRIPFGQDRTTQCYFWLDGLGAIYADSVPIFESVVQWIESYSMQEMVQRWKNCVRVILPEPESGFSAWASTHLKSEPAASGKYGRWWTGSECALNRFLPWIDGPREHWNWLYATTKTNGELWADKFHDTFGLTALRLEDWP